MLQRLVFHVYDRLDHCGSRYVFEKSKMMVFKVARVCRWIFVKVPRGQGNVVLRRPPGRKCVESLQNLPEESICWWPSFHLIPTCGCRCA